MENLTDPNQQASDPWIEETTARLPTPERELVRRAEDWARKHYLDRADPTGRVSIEHARAAATSLGGMRVGGEAIAAMLLLGARVTTRSERDALTAMFGSQVIGLVEGVTSMAQIQILRSKNLKDGKAKDRALQLEALRKMFLAMAQDVRVVLIKLADQVQRLRELASDKDDRAREEVARETLELFAPLANRLGAWQLKWELEDLAFRYLEPETYRNLARQLDEKRSDRERYIAGVARVLSTALASNGVTAEVSGRPKHIYSIWRKMQRKGVGLADLFDVRAVRVMVADVKACYAVLGVVHDLWTPIPHEFDDYIARPKANRYRSLHTSVVGPDMKILEVQIRTYEMHDHAELGVAAHWRYKEAAKPDRVLDDKIAWLRHVLEWKDELADSDKLAEDFRTNLFQDAVYVVTPQGRIVDLPQGSTPVDFAYHLHSDLGHHCRGAKVNGHIVPLSYVLSNGERVEIISAKDGGPSRDWLNPTLGYIKSNRARTKIRQWFNNQQLNEAIANGRLIVEKELQRLGKTGQNLEQLAGQLGFTDLSGFFAAMGRGEVTPRQLQSAVHGEVLPETKPAFTPAYGRPAVAPTGVLIVGVDRLLTLLARCCKPAPPDKIVGFVTRGRGITVHRADCRNVIRLPQERLVAADWGNTAASRFPVDIEIVAGCHPALMRDILEIFTREKVRILSSVSQMGDSNVRMAYTLEVEGLPQLTRLLVAARAIPGVELARRK